ncbi:type I glyceraldehyde-3-phosphate dehydrogenase [Alphaproteobacteria bacterium]|nr:type I glyceraldehyde-3-phosphate dehydrogenase [Alphaproteobacteria bacterium]
MKKKVAINGFGRIGRLVFRAYLERSNEFNETYEISYINDLADIDSNIHLLKYDSVHGVFGDEIQKTADNKFKVGQNEITVTSEKNPIDLNWAEKEIDVILECTGVFASKEKALLHVESGAKKVVVSAPCTNADFTVVQGVNHEKMNSDHVIISNASCTTNCLSPVAYVIDKEFGIENGYMTTIHSYTGDQNTVDTFHKDLRRARTAANNIIPTSTGAAKAVGLVLPHLKGKLDGTAIRVPTPNVSLVDFKFNTQKAISVNELNKKFQEYANGPLKGIMGVDTDPKVSSDYNHDSRSSILDLTETTAVSDNFGRVLTWYDNEWGFSNRMLETTEQVCKL